MINDNLIKAIVLVTIMQSLMLIGIEIASYYREQRYIEKIEQMEMFNFTEEDFEDDILDFTEVPNFSDKDHTPVEKLDSRNVITIA